MADTSVSDKKDSSSFNSPFAEYEEQLKSLQQLEDDQDDALRSIEVKIEEMKKQQETMRMQKELARTKALGVRAKLSMLQRASASPKIQSPVSTPMKAPTQPSPSPAKRPSPYVEESSSAGAARHGSSSRMAARHQAKRGKFDRPVVEGMSIADVDAVQLAIDEIIYYPQNDTLPLFNEIRDCLSKLIATEAFRVHEKPVSRTDNRHDHIHVVKKPQDFLEFYVEPPSTQEETLDTLSPNQPDVSVNLKDHGRSHNMTEFTPYQSPLHRFRSFQYFGGPSNKSMAYSNPVDTSKNLCTFELAGGTCNDDTCRSRHFRDFDLSPTDVMQDLLTYSRCENDGTQMKDQKTLERMFATMDAARTKKPVTYVRAALDIRRRNLSSNQLQKVSFIPSPARRQEAVKRKVGGQHTVKPVAQKLPMTSALQPLLVPGSTMELRYFEVDERNYPTESKNIPGWVRAVVQSLPSTQFADYDKANSKSLDLNAAINILRQALARNPTSDLLWCLYVELWMYRGDEKMFEREMEQALRNVPYCLDLMWYNVLMASTVEDQITASDDLLRYFNSDEAIKTIGIVAREQTNVGIIMSN
jgi:Putative zinc-finger domain